MQRDSTAHLPVAADADGAANDTRDTPLNRLLRRSNPTPEAPGKPLAAPASASETPVDKPASAQPSGLEKAIVRPSAAQVSPGEMLVKKLLGKQNPARDTRADKPARAPASVPDVFAGGPVDVEYTPVESSASTQSANEPRVPEAVASSVVPAHVAALVMPAAKPLGTQGTATEKPVATAADIPVSAPDPAIDKLLPRLDVNPEAPVATPRGAPGSVPAAVVGKPREDIAPQPPATPLPARAAVPDAPVSKPLDPQRSAPDPAIERMLPKREAAPETLIARPLGAQSSAPDMAIDKLLPEAPIAQSRGAQGTAVGKLLPRPAAAPETSDGEPQSTALEKSAGKLLRLPRRTRDEREFLPAALEIVDTPPSPVGRAIGLTIIAVAVIAIIWACIGQVDIVATASGRIVPQGKTKIVQPADTGIVTAIHVTDGDHVKAGDPLIELNSTQVAADRDRFVRDLLQANLTLSRLRGLAATLPGSSREGKAPNLVTPPKDAKPEDIALALSAMRAQAANENAKLADLDQQIEAKQAEAAEAQASVEKLQASLPMLVDQEKLLRAMRDQKIGSKLDWYQINQQLIEQQHEIGVLAHRKDAAAAAQRALSEQRAAEVSQFQMQVLADLDKTRAQASELDAELAKAQQRTRQSVLAAPIDGTVQQLAIHTIGGVVTPAESLLAIVPDDDSLVVEAVVQNRDVGFITAGQTVRVKVEAFNFTLYGLIDGKVLDVTRDAVSHPANDKKNGQNSDQNDGDNVANDANSGPVYLAHIALSQDWMMTENGKVPLTAGMAVSAEIQTGQRRLISYLLSPLVRHVSESMHER